jgi:hypothetical protein
MSLTELYNLKKDVLFDSISEDWKDSFNKFMFGQTCTINENEKLIAYYQDFALWYRINKAAIEREIKIDNAIE